MRQTRTLPIRDRRQRPRIVTLRNFGKLMLGLVVLFLVVNIRSEMRRPTHGQYGRLFSKEVPQASEELSTQTTAPIVEAAPIADQSAPDPMLIAGSAQEEYLGVREPSASAMPAQVAQPEDFFRPEPVLRSSKGKVAIVGDGNGVAIVQGSVAQQPRKLSGGFMRE